MRRQLPILALTLIVLLASCGASSFAGQLRVVLAASGPLVESLNLGDKKAAVVTDFADLATASGHLSDDLKICGKDKKCSLDAVSVFEVRFWDVLRRGHFKLSPKLEKVQEVMAGLITSAKIFYGQRQTVARGTTARTVTEADLKAQVDELKVALKP